jgi:hypothetical protein
MALPSFAARFAPHTRAPLSRRKFMGSAVVVGALLPTAANAITSELRALPGTLPEREDVLSWEKLSAAKFGDFTKPAEIPADVLALAGQIVRLEGYPLPFDDAAQATEFVLMSVAAHCPYCLPGGMGSMALVSLQSAVAMNGQPLLLEGTLKIEANNLGGPVYAIEQARVIGA